jgi:hypothetical protein
MKVRSITAAVFSLFFCGALFAATTPLHIDTNVPFSACNGDTGTLGVLIRGEIQTVGSNVSMNVHLNGIGDGEPSGLMYVVNVNVQQTVHLSGNGPQSFTGRGRFIQNTQGGEGHAFGNVLVTGTIDANGNLVIDHMTATTYGCPDFGE